MAYKIPNQTGDSNVAANYNTNTNTPSLHATTDITISTSNTFTATFTAPNLTNAADGLLLFLVSKGTATSIIATLQENLAGSWADTAHTVTVTLSNLVSNDWFWARPASTYTFATTTANRYRWKITCDTGTCTLAQASTANPAFISWDNRTGEPANLDITYASNPNGTTPIVLTLKGTFSTGNDTGALGTPSSSTRTIQNALIITNGAKVVADQAGNLTCNLRGEILCGETGEFEDGTSSARLSSAYTHEYIGLGANGNPGVMAYTGSKFKAYGTEVLDWRAETVSGVGTAANPLITTGNIGDVGTEVWFAASSNDAANYDQCERRFIITKNSATSYVLSTTAGGAEAALTHSHPAGTRIANVKRNIIFRGNSSAAVAHYMFYDNTPGNVEIDSVRFQHIGGSLFFGVAQLGYVLVGVGVKFNNNVVYDSLYTGLVFASSTNGTVSSEERTYSNNIAWSPTTSGAANENCTVLVNAQSSKVFENLTIFGHQYSGVKTLSSYTDQFPGLEIYGSNRSNIANNGGFYPTNSGALIVSNARINANRGRGVALGIASSIVFTDSEFGTLGYNQTRDVGGTASALNTALFTNCNFGSSLMIDEYLTFALGSEVAFHAYNGNELQHGWYNATGYTLSEPTVIRSPGLAVKMVPQNTTIGHTWQFKVPIQANSSARFQGFFLKNANLGAGVVTIEAYLPGNPVALGNPDIIETLTNDTGSAFVYGDEQSVDRATFFNSNIPGAMEVVVRVKSNTAGAALYIDDLFNAGDRTNTKDEITGLNLWVDGKPLPVISPSVPSATDNAAAVWAAPKVDNNIPGTMGEKHNQNLTKKQFNSLS